MKTTTKMKISIVLAVGFLLVFSESLFACHQDFWGRGLALKGHSGDYAKIKKGSKSSSAFGYTTEPTSKTTEITTYSFYGTTDSTATSTNCKWRTANIEKGFNESYEQIAEESAQGSGQHLEALASLTGCSAEQYETFETVIRRNHGYVFADKDYDGSTNNFFTVLNTDKDLKQCFGNS